MIQTSPPLRRHHRLAWFFFFVALIEAAAIVAFAESRTLAAFACGATGALARAPVQPDGVADGIGPGAQLPVLPTSNAAPPSPEVSAAGADAAQASGDVHAQGDTNQIVDPKCVANAAVAALQAGTPAPGPSCGPMQQPEALKAAEKQLSR
jgi:hypothetical protein